ncbi:hypothetical protein JW960_12035 [candidate division KSB1 bacterium]|nr:hypothetical protein [candidate division KSB1 bacterium]
MSILFFFVHPSKFHLFKHTIRHLKSKGYDVDIAIVSKDVLEQLVKTEGWHYTNIAPNGRRSKRLKGWAATIYHAWRTIRALQRLTRSKKYNLFVTDDLLSVIGWMRKVTTLHFQDSDLHVVPESAALLELATYVVAPSYTILGRYSVKKLPYNGYHELAYLHPNYFEPDESIVSSIRKPGVPYFIIRLVSLTATHDQHKRGLNDEQVHRLISLLSQAGDVYISAERQLPDDLEPYRLPTPPEAILHVLAFADMLISDSQTMTTEAALLGTPAIRCNDFVGRISSMERLEHEYGLTFGFLPDKFDDMMAFIHQLLDMPNRKTVWQKRRKRMLIDTIDVTEFIIETIKEYSRKSDVRYRAVLQSSTCRAE